MILNRSLLILALLFIVSYSDAQVFLTGLKRNTEIKEYLSKNIMPVRSQSDTLSLPFFDDFSYTGPYPSEKYWVDNKAFVNRTFSDNAPSIGVATLDALDDKGDLYTTLSQNESVGDYLTSKFINLKYYTIKNPFQISTSELFFLDTASGNYYPSDSLWYVVGASVLNCNTTPTTFNVDMYISYIEHGASGTVIIDANEFLYYFDGTNYVAIPYMYSFDYAISDSLYLSFYFQPQGLSANAPEATDSLILEFWTPDLQWHTVWRQSGSPVKDFEQVLIPILNTEYLTSKFRFRFKNYVSTGGSANPSWNNNCDYWNIDYIYLNKGRTYADTIPDDVVLADQRVSFLKKYTMVPWEHFKAVPSLREDTIKFVIKNLSDVGKDVLRNVNVYLYPSNLVFNPNPGSENIQSLSTDTAKFPLTTNIFSASQGDSAHFYAKFTVNGGLSQNQLFFGNNDTIFQDQYFHHYYAWDDGTAENGFGLGGIGTQNAMLAYRFVTAKPDSLRGIYMYFNPTVDSASQKYFYLTVWSNSGGYPSSVIYQKTGELPSYEEGAYKFHYYPLDTVKWITDTFYVGWKQTTTDLLNIGFDANNDNSANILYNITGYWQQCPYQGSLMMRPVFSTSEYLSSGEKELARNPVLYPNPNSGSLFISTEGSCDVEIMDIQGRVLYYGTYSDGGIDTTPFDNGIYIVVVSGSGNRFTQRIVIQK